MSRVGILCPGQGAQHLGMGSALWQSFGSTRAFFDEASDVLGSDFRRLCFEGDDNALRDTALAQPALYVVGYASWQACREVWQDRAGAAIEVVVAAGHSLGEYTALAAAGALAFADGLRLVARRGHLMSEAGGGTPGSMLAILGLPLAEIEAVCAEVEAATSEVVVVANDNAPGQIVISGTVTAVNAAGTLAKERGARRCVALATSGAFHSPLMAPAMAELRRAIEHTEFERTAFDVIANCRAEPVREPFEVRAELTEQLCARVRWVESIRRLGSYQLDALVELAPGQVLSGLVRRIEPKLLVLSIGDGEQIDTMRSATWPENYPGS